MRFLQYFSMLCLYFGSTVKSKQQQDLQDVMNAQFKGIQ